jgi:hypothetical protein
MHHFIFMTLAPWIISPVCAIASLLTYAFAVFLAGAGGSSWYETSITGSVWCYTAVVAVSMTPILDRVLEEIEERGRRGEAKFK